MTRVLFITHDVVGTRMAGPGVRAAELCRVLAREHAVTLATPQPADALPPGVAGFAYRPGDAASLRPALAAAEVVVADGHVLAAHPELAGIDAPLVLDMYDPTLLENLTLFRGTEAGGRAARSREDVALLLRQLRAGDCFLCATERQRDLYLGALLATGRVTPALADADPTLRGLLRVVPFGLPAEPPQPAPPPWPPLEPGAQVILWTGGLWDWMDPLTLLDAMPLVLERAPLARLVFLAGQHPGNPHPMRAPALARERAAALGLLDRAVLFVDAWVPYQARAGALLNAQVGVSLHGESLEREYAAVRSRFLDHLWAGLPSVVSAGDAAAALVASHGLGRVVPPGNAAATAAALIELLCDPAAHQTCAANARALAAGFTWDTVAAPLLDFCRAPRRAPDTERLSSTTHESVSAPAASAAAATVAERDARARTDDLARNAALQRAAELTVVREGPAPGGLAGWIRALLFNQCVRPFLAPLLEQQNARNAAVQQALDALAESSDRRRSEMYAALDQLAGQLGAHERRMDAHERRMDAHERRLDEVNGRLADLDAADTLLAERLAAPPPENGP
jgi:glycosyltransferase involved in cell wall biosynthesis